MRILHGSHLTSFRHIAHSSPFSLPRQFASSMSLLMSNTATADQCNAKASPTEYFRKDYQPCPYVTSDIYLSFKLSAAVTEVISKSTIVRNKLVKEMKLRSNDLVLDGEDLSLNYIKINGNTIPKDYYNVDESTLTISSNYLEPLFVTAANGQEPFVELETSVNIRPEANLALSGLYKSANMLCTQCEAMGFRRITYSQDRPDVLTKFMVHMEADKATFPLLLSNGNILESGDSENGKHWALWQDPYPKPTYLFALVAADNLACLHDTYVTTSGRNVKLGIYSEKANGDKLAHAMYSLKKSMKWDEDTFGLECDLNIYNVVATDDFNMGAMENKGLNIFNSAYVLANPKTATDTDYERILGVIGHEYFHNWSGNRVTVRDWFQLTLKEGLTVMRDQWFSADETSHAVKRIEDVRVLRAAQFKEDQGPMAHPIRPESYISMDNFYTSTVYNKGAEIVRIYKTLLGESGFKKGLKLYFQRHDGSAVTCDDFRAAMADANNADLSQLDLWYSQAGTPILSVTESYDETSKRYKLTFKQRTPTTPGQPEESKKPLLMPIVVGLLSRRTGKELLPSTVLQFNKAEQEFIFENIPEAPILSLLRDFSAPVKVEHEQTDEDLTFLMAHDTDAFTKWNVADQLSSSVILSLTKFNSVSDIKSAVLPDQYVNAARTLLQDALNDKVDFSLVSYALQLRDESTLAQSMQVIDVDKIHAARGHVKKMLATSLKPEFEKMYKKLSVTSEYQFNPLEVAKRRLKATCLDFLSSLETPSSAQLCKAQYDSATCMTDRIAAVGCLSSIAGKEREEALSHFHAFAAGDALVLNKWFSIQAMADLPDLLDRVKALKKHPDFIISNPNRARSLLSVFAGNSVHFHASDGKGYEFVADNILELDALNPQVSARMASVFSQWKRFDTHRQELMKKQLERIRDKQGLSKDTFEVVSRCLA